MSQTFFNCGLFWLSGFAGGSAYGMLNGLRTAPARNMRISTNSALNQASKYGNKTANIAGSVAFIHTVVGWVVEDLIEMDRYVDNVAAKPMLTGLLTGGFYKCATGPRGAALAAVIGGAVSTSYALGGSFIYNSFFRGRGRFTF